MRYYLTTITEHDLTDEHEDMTLSEFTAIVMERARYLGSSIDYGEAHEAALHVNGHHTESLDVYTHVRTVAPYFDTLVAVDELYRADIYGECDCDL